MSMPSYADPWSDRYVAWLFSSMEEIKCLADELENLINNAQDERPLQAFFEQNPGLLIQLLQGGHGRWVFPKPRFGSEYVPDFALCEKDSSGYHWHLVELENPNFDVLTNEGQPTAKFTHAIKQISDWRIWLRSNCKYAQNELGYRNIGMAQNPRGVSLTDQDFAPRPRKASGSEIVGPPANSRGVAPARLPRIKRWVL